MWHLENVIKLVLWAYLRKDLFYDTLWLVMFLYITLFYYIYRYDKLKTKRIRN